MKKLKLLALMIVCSTLSQAQDIVKMEYWIDADPGFNAAFPITGFNQQPDVPNFSFLEDSTLNLSPGIHTIGIRSKDATGQWSHTNFSQLYVAVNESQGAVTRYEYFWDVDSGFNAGSTYIPPFTVSDTANYGFDANIPVLGANMSNHMFFIRTLDSTGKWSHTNYQSVFVKGTVSLTELAEQSGINVYPNPFTDAITVVSGNNEISRLIMYDVNGRKVVDKMVTQETKLEVHDFSPGSYTLFLWSATNKIYRSTIIKM